MTMKLTNIFISNCLNFNDLDFVMSFKMLEREREREREREKHICLINYTFSREINLGNSFSRLFFTSICHLKPHCFTCFFAFWRDKCYYFLIYIVKSDHLYRKKCLFLSYQKNIFVYIKHCVYSKRRLISPALYNVFSFFLFDYFSNKIRIMRFIVWRFISTAFDYFSRFENLFCVNIKYFFTLFFASEMCAPKQTSIQIAIPINLLKNSTDSLDVDISKLYTCLYMKITTICIALKTCPSNNILSRISLPVYCKLRKYIASVCSFRYEFSFCCRLAPY